MKLDLRMADWSFEPTVTIGLIALVVVYAAAWRRGLLRRSDDVTAWLPSPVLRPWLFAAGVLAAVVALDSPIDEGGDAFLFWLHMIQHLLLMMVAPPLILLGLCGMAPMAASGWRRSRALGAFVTRPWVACALFNAVMLTWHIPALYNATLTSPPVHIGEHLSFMVAGVMFWWPVVEPIRRPARTTVPSLTKIAMLVIAGVPPTILGFGFVTASTAIYPFYALAPRLWGFTPLGDQQLAGTIMIGLGNVIYFMAVAFIFVRMFEDPAADEAAAAGRAALGG